MNSPLNKAWSHLHRFPVQIRLAVLWVLVLGLVEIGGRSSPNDWYDGIGVIALLITGSLSWMVCSAHRFRGVAYVGTRARDGLKYLTGWDLDAGVDFRLTPELPRGGPPGPRRLLLITAVCTVILALSCGTSLSEIREGVRQVSSALWIMGLSLLWPVLVVGGLGLFAMPPFIVHGAVKYSTRLENRGRWIVRSVSVALHFLVVGLGVFVFPAWAPLAVLALAYLGTALVALMPGGPTLSVMWRDESGSITRVTSLASGTLTNLASLACVTASLYLLTCGEELVGPAGETAPATSFFGLAFAWSSAVVFCVCCGSIATNYLTGRFRDPAKSWPGRVHVSGSLPLEKRAALGDVLKARGLRLLPVNAREIRGDVRIEYREATASAPLELQTMWPLVVAPADFEEGGSGLRKLVERVQRRDQILRRRQLLHGLRRLFKVTKRVKIEEGTGYWVAPQHWFIRRFSRDGDESTEFIEGPAYHPTLSIRSRAHFNEVMQGCGLDIMFVEDGVSFRRVKRVLLMLFEFYDLFDGKRPAEERHFSGLPGIRVLIHEQDLSVELPKGRYPEPDYEGLGRSRVLHIFKDRGDEEEPSVTPVFPDFEPEPVPLGW